MDTDESIHAARIRDTVSRYAAPLTRYALLITGDLETARDVVQDTFVRLCAEKPDRLDSHLAQWLFTVCRNRALDVQRKQNRMEPLSETALSAHASPELSPSAAAEQRESTGEVLELITMLSPNQQEVVRLKFQNGLSYQEISQITNLSIGNVGFLIHTALKTIRQQLQARPVIVVNPKRRAV